jgi:hypothetical protein
MSITSSAPRPGRGSRPIPKLPRQRIAVAPLRSADENTSSIFASATDAECSRRKMTRRPSRSTRSRSRQVFRRISSTRWFASSWPYNTQYWDSSAIPSCRKRTPHSNSSSVRQKWTRWLLSGTSSWVTPSGILSGAFTAHHPTAILYLVDPVEVRRSARIISQYLFACHANKTHLACGALRSRLPEIIPLRRANYQRGRRLPTCCAFSTSSTWPPGLTGGKAPAD